MILLLMIKDILKKDILKLLALEYSYDQGLHVEKSELMGKLAVDEKTLDDLLISLENDELVNIYRDRKGRILLVKITWRGLKEIGDIKLKYGKGDVNG